VVLCVYLFHELPPAVRKLVAKEMARVLKPGGLLVLTDSVFRFHAFARTPLRTAAPLSLPFNAHFLCTPQVQRGDRLPALDQRLDLFTDLNEPYYATYVREDLTAMLQAEVTHTSPQKGCTHTNTALDGNRLRSVFEMASVRAIRRKSK
jgi:SAM-dependent methyltransferase